MAIDESKKEYKRDLPKEIIELIKDFKKIRLNMDNLVEPVTKELDFQVQTPFLLYRNHAGDIYGIWFFEQVTRFCLFLGRVLIVIVLLG